MNNDDKILALKKQLEEKKSNIKSDKVKMLTNGIFTFEGKQINLQTFNMDQRNNLIDLIVKITLLRDTAEKLGYIDEYKIDRLPINDILSDLNSRMDYISVSVKLQEIKSIEAKLSTLLSADKRVELEIDSLDSIVKNM